jgi:hypothetical protein
MNKTIVYSLVAVAGIMLAIITFTIQDFNKTTEPNIVKKDGVIYVNGQIPPQLSDLFPDQEDGPHQKYVDEKSCLKCHNQEMTIPGMGLVSEISHEFRSDCVSCHLLPSKAI